MLIAALAVAAAASAPPPVYTPPEIAARPAAADFKEVRARTGVLSSGAGEATIDCIVGADGALRKCLLVSESPPEQRFGAAALRLSDSYVFHPAMSGGKAIDSEVQIHVRFPDPKAATTVVDLPGPS